MGLTYQGSCAWISGSKLFRSIMTDEQKNFWKYSFRFCERELIKSCWVFVCSYDSTLFCLSWSISIKFSITVTWRLPNKWLWIDNKEFRSKILWSLGNISIVSFTLALTNFKCSSKGKEESTIKSKCFWKGTLFLLVLLKKIGGWKTLQSNQFSWSCLQQSGLKVIFYWYTE